MASVAGTFWNEQRESVATGFHMVPQPASDALSPQFFEPHVIGAPPEPTLQDATATLVLEVRLSMLRRAAYSPCMRSLTVCGIVRGWEAPVPTPKRTPLVRPSLPAAWSSAHVSLRVYDRSWSTCMHAGRLRPVSAGAPRPLFQQSPSTWPVGSCGQHQICPLRCAHGQLMHGHACR